MNSSKLKPLILVGRGRFISVLVWGLFILLLAGGCGEKSKSTPETQKTPASNKTDPADGSEKSEKTVQLTFDFGDDQQKHFDIPWHEKMTVLDAIQAASELPEGFTFKMKGKKAMAFIEQFNGVKNQGGGENSKNWLFWVNGQFAQRGIGTLELNPSDVVLWKFAEKHVQ